MEVYVIRHTKVAVGRDTCYGQTDVPLADTFFQDIEYYKKELPKDFDIVYCSPLKRCKQLAEALHFTNVVFENALMEMNFGDWENKKWNSINPDEFHQWMNDFVHTRTLNGESLMDLFDRLKLFIDNLRPQPYKKVLLITHAGVIRCLWAYLLDIPLHNIFKLAVGYNDIFIFNLTNNKTTDHIQQKQ